LSVAILFGGGTLLSRWAVNAEAFGKHKFGLALSLSFLPAYGLYASLAVAAVSAIMSGVYLSLRKKGFASAPW
jgi:hypothetical protein